MYLFFLLDFQGGQTALMCAAQAGKLELVQELLHRGADVKAVDEVSVIISRGSYYFWMLIRC